MNWIWTKDQEPPKDRTVIGLALREYINSDWDWSEPYAYRVGCTWARPDIWCELDLPPIPENAARTNAIKHGERERRIYAEIDRLKKELETA